MCDDFEAESGIKLGTAQVPGSINLQSIRFLGLAFQLGLLGFGYRLLPRTFSILDCEKVERLRGHRDAKLFEKTNMVWQQAHTCYADGNCNTIVQGMAGTIHLVLGC